MIDEPRGRWGLIFAAVRRVTVFLLGVAIVISALIDPDSSNTVSMLIVGMVMVGVLPMEDLFFGWRSRMRDKERER